MCIYIYIYIYMYTYIYIHTYVHTYIHTNLGSAASSGVCPFRPLPIPISWTPLRHPPIVDMLRRTSSKFWYLLSRLLNGLLK